MSGADAGWEGHPQFGKVGPCRLAWLEGMVWDRAGGVGMPGSPVWTSRPPHTPF